MPRRKKEKEERENSGGPRGPTAPYTVPTPNGKKNSPEKRKTPNKGSKKGKGERARSETRLAGRLPKCPGGKKNTRGGKSFFLVLSYLREGGEGWAFYDGGGERRGGRNPGLLSFPKMGGERKEPIFLCWL